MTGGVLRLQIIGLCDYPSCILSQAAFAVPCGVIVQQILQCCIGVDRPQRILCSDNGVV